MPSPSLSFLRSITLLIICCCTNNNNSNNDEYSGGILVLSVEASRAYPHGCLYRHPSYYTYDERDDISWYTNNNNHHPLHLEVEDGSALVSSSKTAKEEFSDYRTLPPASHPIRRSYHQYKLLRRLGAGKFSNVFEAVDVVAAANANANSANARRSDGDDTTIKKNRRKKIPSSSSSAVRIQDDDDANNDDATNEMTTTTDASSSDNESPSSTTASTTTTIDPNTLVVLKCLKPISERKIRRELLVLTHCKELPNLARLIGIVIPSSMENNDDGGGGGGSSNEKNDNDERDGEELMKKDEGGNKRDYHRRHYHHHQQQSNHHARKRRRYNHRISRQLHHKQQQQKLQQQRDIGSITTDAAAVDVTSQSQRKGGALLDHNNDNSSNTSRNNSLNIKDHQHGMKNTALHPLNDAVKDVNLSKKTNNNNSNSQHGEQQQQVPALVLEHAGQTAQWFCHGPRPLPSSSTTTTTTTTTTEEKDHHPTTNKPHHHQHNQYQNLHHQTYQNHLTEYEIKYYLCHLLIALDGLHAAGIMHRDVKPRNTLINLCEVPVFSSVERMKIMRRRRRGGVVQSSAAAVEQSTSMQSTPPPAASAAVVLPPQPLMLVDLGLADFYLPGKEFNVRVASRHYKSPELLIGYEYYDYAIDMWSVGCILAGLLFRIEPFFRGMDNEDQLGRIVNCLGTRDFLPYCRKCNVRLSSKARAAIGKYCSESSHSSSSSSSSSSEDAPISLTNSDIGRRKPWLSFLTSDCPVPSSEATDLLDKLLVYDHEQRWTAREALSHSFFDEVRDEVWSEVQERILWEKSQGRSI